MKALGLVPSIWSLRAAQLDDQAALKQLIERAARASVADRFTEEQIAWALRGAAGSDTHLIRDMTYFVVEDSAGTLVGCGGWTGRRLFAASEQCQESERYRLPPPVQTARIRALFVDPSHGQMGIGSAILEQCESEALAAGFCALDLMSTLTRMPYFKSRGYRVVDSLEYEVERGTRIQLFRMRKGLSQAAAASDTLTRHRAGVAPGT